MAKIAVEVERALAERARAGAPGRTAGHLVASGDGWTVEDVICTSGPNDRSFEEEHSGFSIAVVLAGSFQYCSASGRQLMTPGSLLLGNDRQRFECGHEHAAGDRCLSFRYAPDYFDRLAADAGMPGPRRRFAHLRVPPVRDLSGVVAKACAGLSRSASVPWAELGLELAARAIHADGGRSGQGAAPAAHERRVTGMVRTIAERPDSELTLAGMAREAGLSPYHFLRTFEQLTGVTPHRYVMRARLREAATRLLQEPGRVLEIALDSGFGDVSNFNRAFRTEFGVSPRAYRAGSKTREGG